MVDSRINDKIIIKLGIGYLVLTCISICIIGYFIHENKLLKVNNNSLSTDKTKIEIEAEKKVQKSESVIDSLKVLIKAKQQTIINNTYIYEQQNKDIGSLSSDATDSLYRLNLRAGYNKYGHLIKE